MKKNHNKGKVCIPSFNQNKYKSKHNTLGPNQLPSEILTSQEEARFILMASLCNKPQEIIKSMKIKELL